MDPHHTAPSAGNATDPLENGTLGIYRSETKNLAFQRDNALRARNWCLAIIAICVLAVVFIATTFNYKTYVVRVDNATGAVETGGQLHATNYSPKEAEIKHFLAQWIRDTRSVPMDPVAFKRDIEHAQHFMTNEAAQKYSGLIKNHNPSAKLGHATVIPEIRSIQLQPGSQNTYQIRWSETDFSLSGSMSNKKLNYIALMSIGVDPPTAEKELLINPLGLKITDLTLSVESESTVQPTTATAQTGGSEHEAP